MPTASTIRLLISATVLCCVSAGAQTPPRDPPHSRPCRSNCQQNVDQQPITTLHATNARAVLLDVVVTDGHGHPVPNLTPQAFHIFEDDKPQTVISLEEHHAADAGGDRQTAQAASAARQLPSLTSIPRRCLMPRRRSSCWMRWTRPLEAQIIARDELLKWVNTMQPGNQVAIFQLNGTLKMIQGFTTDPAVLKEAIKNRIKTNFALAPQGGGITTATGQLGSITNAMQTLGTYLQTIPGRKDLIWFTGHIPRTTYDNGSPIGGSLHDGQSLLVRLLPRPPMRWCWARSRSTRSTRAHSRLCLREDGVVSTVGNSITGQSCAESYRDAGLWPHPVPGALRSRPGCRCHRRTRLLQHQRDQGSRERGRGYGAELLHALLLPDE